jgi:hypothetical protein
VTVAILDAGNLKRARSLSNATEVIAERLLQVCLNDGVDDFAARERRADVVAWGRLPFANPFE